MVLVADDLSERSVARDVADQPSWPAVGLGIEDADAFDALAGRGLEEPPEELVEPADHQHGDALASEGVQVVTDREEVVLHLSLPRILSTAADDHVGVLRERLSGMVRDHLRFVPVPLGAP